MDTSFSHRTAIRHHNNVGLPPITAQSLRMNKNPHAVALGKMSSPAKAAAAQKNGEKGGRPKGS